MFYDFINLFYPKLCKICETGLNRNEKILCAHCLHELPVANFQLNNENYVKKVFYGRIDIVYATSLLIFHKKGSVQKLLHQLKYRGEKDISFYLGSWLGREIKKDILHKEIEVVIPVPLHKYKLKQRGFNQVEGFGKEIAQHINASYIDSVLIKKSSSKTQTLKNRLTRWGKLEETFVIQNGHLLENKHILLVDDLITTGATIEACVKSLDKIHGIKISVATMAIAG